MVTEPLTVAERHSLSAAIHDRITRLTRLAAGKEGQQYPGVRLAAEHAVKNLRTAAQKLEI